MAGRPWGVPGSWAGAALQPPQPALVFWASSRGPGAGAPGQVFAAHGLASWARAIVAEACSWAHRCQHWCGDVPGTLVTRVWCVCFSLNRV